MRYHPLLSRMFLILICICFSFSFTTADEKTDKVDKLFATWDSTVSPGAALAIIKDGKIIYERGYGMADLEHSIAITPETVFRIGSVSKQFTAACIALLSIEEKISLDDNIRKYLPELPDYKVPISIYHLIHHTSGLRDYLSLEDLRGKSENDFYTPQDTMELLTKQKTLNFSPGEQFLYSNTGYFLLGVIVQRASGQTLNEFAIEHIFQPLDMRHTHYQDDHTTIVKNRAQGYAPTKSGYKIDMTTLDHVGDGGVFTTVEDLYLWDQAFYSNILGKKLIDILQTRGCLNNGKIITYAFGLDVDEYRGLKRVHHSGGFAGFNSYILRFPEQNFSVICLSNLSTFNPTKLGTNVADIYLESQFTKAKPLKKKIEGKPIKLSSPELDANTGIYHDKKDQRWFVIRAEEGELAAETMGDKFKLFPVSKTLFVNKKNDLVLEFFPKSQEAKLYSGQREPLDLEKSAPYIKPNLKQLKTYTGNYYSDELLTTYKIALKDEKLIFAHKNAPKSSLISVAPDTFTSGWWIIKFIRNKAKKISGFQLGAGRAACIKFQKK